MHVLISAFMSGGNITKYTQVALLPCIVGSITLYLERWFQPATFPILRQTGSQLCDQFVGKAGFPRNGPHP